MVWIDEAGDRSVVFRLGFQSKKQLFTIFFNHAGPLVVDILSDKTTMTSRHYTGTVLPNVVAAVQEKRPNVGPTRTLLLHDNADPHKTRATILYLDGEKLQVLPHPPYSPDLAPCDCWLFSTLKTGLAGKNFLRIARAVNSQLHVIPCLEYHNAFQKWLRRLQLCVDSNGEVFESP